MLRNSLTTACLSLAATILLADEKPVAPPRLSISELMERAHLKPMNRGTRNNLDSKVIDGKATEAERKELLDLYTQLSQAKPPAGTLDAWQKRTAEIVEATKAVIRGDDQAGERLTKARDCKACHQLHRKLD